MAAGLSTKRLSNALQEASLTEVKELNEITSKGTPPGIELINSESLHQWVFQIAVLGDETIYRGENFALKMVFPERYPIDSPIVTFLVNEQYQPPLHPHVYSNGHICASILGTEWSPVLNAVSICITMQSMLASNKKKERPQGNDRYVRTAPDNPKLTRWVYEDDTV